MTQMQQRKKLSYIFLEVRENLLLWKDAEWKGEWRVCNFSFSISLVMEIRIRFCWNSSTLVGRTLQTRICINIKFLKVAFEFRWNFCESQIFNVLWSLKVVLFNAIIFYKILSIHFCFSCGLTCKSKFLNEKISIAFHFSLAEKWRRFETWVRPLTQQSLTQKSLARGCLHALKQFRFSISWMCFSVVNIWFQRSERSPSFS